MNKSRIDDLYDDEDEGAQARKGGGKAGKATGKGAGKGAGSKAGGKVGAKNAGKPAGRPEGKANDKPATPRARPAVAEPVQAGAIVRKKEFVERVMALSGVSKAATRASLEATLHVLAESFAAGEALAIAGFGKTRVNRHLERAGVDTYVVRFKRTPAKDGAKGVEDDDDDV